MNFNKKHMMLLLIIALSATPQLMLGSAALKPFASDPAPSLATEHDENIRTMHEAMRKTQKISLVSMQEYLAKLIELHKQRLAVYQSKAAGAQEIQEYAYAKTIEEENICIQSIAAWQKILELSEKEHKALSDKNYQEARQYNAEIAYELRSYKKLSLQAPETSTNVFSGPLISFLKRNKENQHLLEHEIVDLQNQETAMRYVQHNMHEIIRAIQKKDLRTIKTSAHTLTALCQSGLDNLFADILLQAKPIKPSPEAADILCTFFAEYINKPFSWPKTKDVMTAFHIAASTQGSEVIKVFLDHGGSFDVAHIDAMGKEHSILEIRVATDCDLSSIKLILSHMKSQPKHVDQVQKAMVIANAHHPENKELYLVLSDALKSAQDSLEQKRISQKSQQEVDAIAAFIEKQKNNPSCALNAGASAAVSSAATPSIQELKKLEAEKIKKEKKAAHKARLELARKRQREADRLAEQRTAALPLVRREEAETMSGSGSMGSAQALAEQARLKDEAIQAQIAKDNAQAARDKELNKLKKQAEKKARRAALKKAQEQEAQASSASAAAPAAPTAAATHNQAASLPIAVDRTQMHGAKELIELNPKGAAAASEASSAKKSIAKVLKQPVREMKPKIESVLGKDVSVKDLPLDTKHKKPLAAVHQPLLPPAQRPPAQKPNA